MLDHLRVEGCCRSGFNGFPAFLSPLIFIAICFVVLAVLLLCALLDAKDVLAVAGGVTGVSTSISAHTNTPAAKESPSTTKM